MRTKVPLTPSTAQSSKSGVNMAIEKLAIQFEAVVTLTALPKSQIDVYEFKKATNIDL